MHPYRNLTLPANAPFELRPAPGKGWGAFATTTIEPQTMILSEEPLIYIPGCINTICQLDLQTKIDELSAEQRAQLALLRIDGDEFKPFATVRDAFKANHFPMICGGHSFAPIGSRLNYSCTPNVKIAHCHCPKVHLQTTTRVEAGTELTIAFADYIQGMTRAERHAFLGYECLCTTCSLDATAQAESDMRRRLIRGLAYLITGQDTVKKMTAPHWDADLLSPLLVPKESHIRGEVDRSLVLQGEEPSEELRAQVEEFRTPLATRAVYWSMALMLLDKEQALQSTLAKGIYNIIPKQMSYLEDEETGAMMLHGLDLTGGIDHLSRYEIFAAASNVYGRLDPGDEAANQALKAWMMESDEPDESDGDDADEEEDGEEDECMDSDFED